MLYGQCLVFSHVVFYYIEKRKKKLKSNKIMYKRNLLVNQIQIHNSLESERYKFIWIFNRIK